MGLVRRPIFTRRRLLIAAVLILLLPIAGWFGARRIVAHWVVKRALAAAGLEPATFRIGAVGLGSVRVVDLSIGEAPWLTVGSVDATYSLPGITARRVRTIDLRDALWTIHVRDGAIDWGYVRAAPGAPLMLNLPCDQVDVGDSVVRVIVDKAVHDVPITGRLTPAAPRTIDGRLELLVMGRTVTLTALAKSTNEQVTVDVEGQADRGIPNAPLVISGTPDPAGAAPDAGSSMPGARLNGTLVRQHADGSTRIDAAVVLESMAERAGNTVIAFSRATVTGQVLLGGGKGGNSLTVTAIVKDPRVGDLTIHAIELKAMKLDGPRLGLETAASGDGWELSGAHGTVAWETQTGEGADQSRSTIFSIGMETSKPVALNWPASGITGLLSSITAAVQVRANGSGVTVREGSLALSGGSMAAGGLVLSDGAIGAVMRSPEAVDVGAFSVTVGDGGTISAAPFEFDPREPRLTTRVTMTNLSLAEWLPLISGDHATGEGRVSGQADVSIDLSAGRPKLVALAGSLRADPGHGFIQITDADALGALLDARDPRFATDPVMRPVRDKIVAALGDFAFNTLTVDLSRRDDKTVALAYLSGFGRHGEDPQGLNVTLDLHVQDAWLDFATRIATESKIRAAASEALDQFFGADGAPPEDP